MQTKDLAEIGNEMNALVALPSSPKSETKIIKKRKRKTKKKKQTYEVILEKKNVIKAIEDKIDESENIPQVLKRKYKKIETNTKCLILTYLPLKITCEEIREFFNTLLTSLDSKYDEEDIRPVIECEMGETKRFAILELIDLESVWKLLKIESVLYKDAKIRISRPKGFFVKHFEGGRYEFDEKGVLKNLEAGEEIRLYMGNIPQYMTDEQVKKLVESFGQLKTFEMKTEFSMGEAVSKGYCFFEYFDATQAENALAKLNDLEIGDKKLKVQRLGQAEDKKKEGVKKAPTKEKETSYLLMFPRLRDPLVQACLTVPVICATPSRVLQLLNICGVEDLFDSEFVQELTNDVREECERFGTIEKVEVPLPDLRTGKCAASVGKVFVKFAYQISAKQARFRLNGRTYARRTVIASFYPEDKFEKKDYLTRL